MVRNPTQAWQPINPDLGGIRHATRRHQPAVYNHQTPDRTAVLLHAARTACGLSQRQLAAQLDVNTRTARRWEHGTSPIPAGMCQRWMDACAARIRTDAVKEPA